MITLDQAGRGMAAARIFPPPPDLRWAVEHSWIQLDAGPGMGDRRRIVPDASSHLIYSLSAADGSPGRRSRLLIVGPRTVYTDADISLRLFTVGIRLRPGVLPLLTRVPASELTDRSIQVDAALGSRGREAMAHAAAATGPAAVHDEIIDLIRARLPAAGEIEPRVRGAVGLLRLPPGNASVSRVARLLSISERTLRLVAQTEIGLPPKRVARVYRVQRAVSLAQRDPSLGWAGVAVQVGCHDQSHLIRDFRMLLGETPEDFLRRGSSHRR